MTQELSPIDKAKFVAARRSVDYIEDGMRVGLGTGSTAAWMVRCLGERMREEGLRAHRHRVGEEAHREPNLEGDRVAGALWGMLIADALW